MILKELALLEAKAPKEMVIDIPKTTEAIFDLLDRGVLTNVSIEHDNELVIELVFDDRSDKIAPSKLKAALKDIVSSVKIDSMDPGSTFSYYIMFKTEVPKGLVGAIKQKFLKFGAASLD